MLFLMALLFNSRCKYVMWSPESTKKRFHKKVRSHLVSVYPPLMEAWTSWLWPLQMYFSHNLQFLRRSWKNLKYCNKCKYWPQQHIEHRQSLDIPDDLNKCHKGDKALWLIKGNAFNIVIVMVHHSRSESNFQLYFFVSEWRAKTNLKSGQSCAIIKEDRQKAARWKMNRGNRN